MSPEVSERGVVFVVDTKLEAVELSLHALAAAVDVAERRHGSIDVTIVNSSDDAAVSDLLRSVDGATVLQAPGASRYEATMSGLAGLGASTVWVGASDSCAAPMAVSDMLEAATRRSALVLASSMDPAPYAAAPLGLLLAGLRQAPSKDVDTVPWLHRWAQEQSQVVVIPKVGAMKQRVREARGFGAQMHVHAGSLAVGPATYTSAATVVATYEDLCRIEIGGYCSIASDVRIMNFGGKAYSEEGVDYQLVTRGMHRPESPSTFPLGILMPEEPFDEPPPGARGERLVIGDDVWIGFGAKVLGEVSIGSGAVIGAGSLVIRDVEPYAVVAGVPAKTLRYRFDEETRRRLLSIEWWDWPQAIVIGGHRWFRGTTADFVDHFDPAGAR